ncbi:MAG: exodeoxyribonuclease 7 large subunit [Lysobacteraceae bacterium]|nr:MAG: exodeoxyribonuclease 7 large subunit [Xanthomonadaceae bacterium]
MTDPAPPRILSPSQLNTLARSLLEESFPLVEVRGEISNLARPASGHLYFTLKDPHAQVRCALFRPRSQWLRFRPENGMDVVVRGKLSLYEPRGDYQLLLDHVEPAGEGALRIAFEALKARLEAEGLFALERKKPRPARIARIAVLTSPTGAAVHDVLSVIRRRFRLLEVELLPVPVQGSEAPAAITRMLQRADASGRYDALLLTRGGGSLEDLAAFNDEALARAVAACRSFTVSAVGHEVDFSITDFVADLRCPTPSAAAEALTPDGAELARRLHADRGRLHQAIRRVLLRKAQGLDGLLRRLEAQQPQRRLKRMHERLDAGHQRLAAAMQQALQLRRWHLHHARARLRAQHPWRRLDAIRQRLLPARRRLQAALVRTLAQRASQLAQLARTLEAVSPLRTLERGYAVLRRDGEIVRSPAQVRPGDRIHARVAEGAFWLEAPRNAPAQPVPPGPKEGPS